MRRTGSFSRCSHDSMLAQIRLPYLISLLAICGSSNKNCCRAAEGYRRRRTRSAENLRPDPALPAPSSARCGSAERLPLRAEPCSVSVLDPDSELSRTSTGHSLCCHLSCRVSLRCKDTLARATLCVVVCSIVFRASLRVTCVARGIGLTEKPRDAGSEGNLRLEPPIGGHGEEGARQRPRRGWRQAPAHALINAMTATTPHACKFTADALLQH